MRRADAAVQRLKGVRLPPPHKFTAFPCVAGACNPVASKPPAARGGVRRKLPSADQGAECTVDAVIAEAYDPSSGGRFHRVKWLADDGQTQPDTTWEPETNLAGAQEAITDFQRLSRPPLVAEEQAMKRGLDEPEYPCTIRAAARPPPPPHALPRT